MRRLILSAFVLTAAACETTPTVDAPAAAPAAGAPFADYRGRPEIIRGPGDGGTEAQGVVFEDTNRNGKRDEGEPGIAGIKVSNGVQVVLTRSDGSYSLPARDDMAVMVIQPSGYQVPHNTNWVPQFSYQHKPAGSPKPFRYGGLPATGPLPEAINFPLVKSSVHDDFTCAVLGDTQTYANQEIGYFRDSTVDDILDRGQDQRPECILAVGDVMGDDLGLIPRLAEVLSVLEAPQWWVHGNHDYDWDADYDEDSADSWRRLYGPNYFAFEIGDALFIALDNVVYPCTYEDAKKPGHDYCVTAENKRYNGRITEEQMAFVRNLLAVTGEDKLVVFAHHIPFVTFMDDTSPIHQTDNVRELYAIVGDRPAVSLSGHTHTTEVFEEGDSFAGWKDAVSVDALPFPHIIAGAGSGSWYQGDFGHDGTPMALQRMGSPKGWLAFDVQGTEFQESYIGANVGRERTMWLSVNTPIFRSWFRQIMAWRAEDPETRDPVPPLSINDLPDVKIITPRDLERGTFITANIWAGSSSTAVTMTIGDQTVPMRRTQAAAGEQPRTGADWVDPFSAQRQLSMARYALESRSGSARNQGVEFYKGSSYGPSAPQPQPTVADRNMHLWRGRLPETLTMGVHAVTVRATDRHGRVTEDTLVIELRDTMPPARFRTDVWEAFENGAPVR